VRNRWHYWVRIRPVVVCYDGLLLLGWTEHACVGACRVSMFQDVALELLRRGRVRSAASALRAANAEDRKLR
jgi:hypothetical protein